MLVGRLTLVTWAQVAGFLVAAGVLVVVPGPNHLFLVTRTLAEGRRAALWATAGIESGTLVHMGLAAAGLSAIVAASPSLLTVVRWAGAAYLAYLAVRTLRVSAPREASAPATGHPFRDGLLVNLLNPKVIIFFLAFVPQFVRPGAPVWVQTLVFGALLICLGATSNLVYVLLADRLGSRVGSNRSGRVGQTAVAVVYAALAAAAVLV